MDGLASRICASLDLRCFEALYFHSKWLQEKECCEVKFKDNFIGKVFLKFVSESLNRVLISFNIVGTHMEPLAMGKIIFSAFFNIVSSEDQNACLLEYCLHVLQLITDCCVHRWGSQRHMLSRVLFWAANHQVADIANNCSTTTTLFSKRMCVWFWTTIKSWLTSTLVFKVFLSFIALGGVWIGVGLLSVD